MVGNAVVAAAIPCLFAMSQTIADERFTADARRCSSSRPRTGSRCSSAARSRSSRTASSSPRSRSSSAALICRHRRSRRLGPGVSSLAIGVIVVLVHRDRARERRPRPPLARDRGALEHHPLLPAALRGRQRAARPAARLAPVGRPGAAGHPRRRGRARRRGAARRSPTSPASSPPRRSSERRIRFSDCGCSDASRSPRGADASLEVA